MGHRDYLIAEEIGPGDMIEPVRLGGMGYTVTAVRRGSHRLGQRFSVWWHDWPEPRSFHVIAIDVYEEDPEFERIRMEPAPPPNPPE